MTPLPLPFDTAQARLVKAPSLEPHQQSTPRNFKTAVDFRQRYLLKHPFLSEFHSRAEFLHAGLLEGDPNVTSYVPQPFQVMIRNKRYTPDCYVVRTQQPISIVELKPRAEMPDKERIPLIHFFAQYGWQFQVISNESVYARAMEAENWLEIVQNLYLARELNTTEAEYHVLEILAQQDVIMLGEIIDMGDRERTYLDEIALFRLLHRGQVQANLAGAWLDLDTEFWLCR